MYTLIAYKKDSDDYCRGCHMAHYGSDLEIAYRIDRTELAKKWAYYIAKNRNLGPNEEGYTFTVLRNGIMVIDSGSSYHCESLEDEEYGKIDNEISQIEAEAKQLAVEIIVAEKAELARKEAEKRDAREIEERKARALAYEKLKQEFEPKID